MQCNNWKLNHFSKPIHGPGIPLDWLPHSRCNEVLKFDQLDVDLSDLQTTTIKEPKIQETSSLKLLLCFLNKLDDKKYCNKNFNKEIISTLNRRFVIPLYIPVITLCCSLLLLRTRKSYLSPYLIFFYSFVILLFT